MWRRKGWLTPIAMIVPMALVQVFVNLIFGDGYYIAYEWPKIVGVFSGVILVAYLGYYLNHKNREIINENSRVERVSDSHAMFFIPIEYWSLIFAVFFTFVIFNET